MTLFVLRLAYLAKAEHHGPCGPGRYRSASGNGRGHGTVRKRGARRCWNSDSHAVGIVTWLSLLRCAEDGSAPGTGRYGLSDTSTNTALTERTLFMVTWQVAAVPLHAPSQWSNTQTSPTRVLLNPEAVSVTTVPYE